MEIPRVGDYWKIQGKENSEVVKVLAVPKGITDNNWHMYNFTCNKSFGSVIEKEKEEIRGILFTVLLDRKCVAKDTLSDMLPGTALGSWVTAPIRDMSGCSLYYTAGCDPYTTTAISQTDIIVTKTRRSRRAGRSYGTFNLPFNNK